MHLPITQHILLHSTTPNGPHSFISTFKPAVSRGSVYRHAKETICVFLLRTFFACLLTTSSLLLFLQKHIWDHLNTAYDLSALVRLYVPSLLVLLSFAKVLLFLLISFIGGQCTFLLLLLEFYCCSTIFLCNTR